MDELEEELRNNDREEFPERLARFREIDAWFQVPPGGLSLGPDWESAAAFSEARFGYINGFWISAILCSLTALERHLAWRLMGILGGNTEHFTTKEITERAVAASLIEQAQADEISQLRIYRNAYAHFRRSSRFIETLRAQEEESNARWEAAGCQDDYIESPNINFVLQPDAKAAVMLACTYFLRAGVDAFSNPEKSG
jgi:hypothetical protein